jgi:hypothetical protein
MKYAGCPELSRDRYPLLHDWFKAQGIVSQYRDLAGGGRVYRVEDSELSKFGLDLKVPHPCWQTTVDIGSGGCITFCALNNLALQNMDGIHTPVSEWEWTDA